MISEITLDAAPWSTDDEARLNAFLLTETGKRFLPKLAEKCPGLLGGGQTNEILIRNGEVRGFQLVLSSLLELTHSPPPLIKSEVTSYPPLDDDTQWNDGQKITQ